MRPALIPLVKARALIADPANWGQGGRASRSNFDSFDVAEALEECGTTNFSARKEAIAFFHKAAGVRPLWGKLIEWNDAPQRTHAEVLAAFDKAIEAAR
jgi:hypothetical protein